MNDYWLLLPTAAFGLIALAFALLWWHEHEEIRILGADYEDVAGHSKRLEQERDEARLQRDKLNTRNAEIVAHNADLREALQDAHDKIKMLLNQTVEVEAQKQEVAPVPKRPARKKAGSQ